MLLILLIILAAAIVSGGILFGVNYWLAKQNNEVLAKRYLISLGVLFVIYLGLFCTLFFVYNSKVDRANLRISKMKVAQRQLKEEHQAELTKLKAFYGKELGLAQWRDKVFTSDKELNQSLNKAKVDYQLSDDEVRTWREIAQNNTLERLIPKRNSRDVLNEYQGRLKNSLKDVKAGHTLMTSDIRMLSDNINAIRFVGKEYENVLNQFKDLYNDIIANNNGAQISMPKQQKFLFFPVKQKQYNQLLQQYYEAKGNTKATEDVATKLKQTIDQAEEEFKQINKKFEDNVAFLQTNADSVTVNSQKLQQLIEAAINEAQTINDTDSQTNIKINNNKKN